MTNAMDMPRLADSCRTIFRFSAHIKPLAMLALGLILMVGMSFTGCTSPQQQQKDEAAREKLDNLLGQTPGVSQSAPQSPQPSPRPQETDPNRSSDPFDRLTGELPNWMRQAIPDPSGVHIQEEVDRYRVSVDLKNPKDANTVELKVEPYRIEVNGQTSFGKAAENGGKAGEESGFSGSSTFMKSFSTQSEVMPGLVKRERQGKQLVFTVPKRHPSSVAAPAQMNPDTDAQPSPESSTSAPAGKPGSPSSTAPLSPEALHQLYQSKPQSI